MPTGCLERNLVNHSTISAILSEEELISSIPERLHLQPHLLQTGEVVTWFVLRIISMFLTGSQFFHACCRFFKVGSLLFGTG